MRRDLARLLVNLYPRAWRWRYEDEFVVLLEARSDIDWRVALDVSLGAAREWGRWLAAWPTREPADDLKSLGRQARAELLLIIAVSALLDASAKAIASGVAHLAHIELSGAVLLFVQTGAALRHSRLPWSGRENVRTVGASELAIWAAAILLAATAAHLDPVLWKLPADAWWSRVTPSPVFFVGMTLLFLTQSTPAARARGRRRHELLALARRNGVRSSPLGLK